MPANQTGTWEKRGRYIELRKEVSAILRPLFTDLNFTDMLMLWTKNGDNTSSLDTLEFNGLNSGLQMSIKEYN